MLRNVVQTSRDPIVPFHKNNRKNEDTYIKDHWRQEYLFRQKLSAMQSNVRYNTYNENKHKSKLHKLEYSIILINQQF